MRMSDLVGAMDLTLFPIIGLVIFVCLFAALVGRALLTDSREARRAAGLPLDDDNAGVERREPSPGSKHHA